MAEKYIARYGKVWADRRTGNVIGAELELKDGESVKSYTQVNEDAPKAGAESAKSKKEKSTSIFEEEAKY